MQSSTNKPDGCCVLLVGERPEEVTDLERSGKEAAEVVRSTIDEPPEHHR